MTERGQRNIVVIRSDDHAAHPISAYGSEITTMAHLDRLAGDGVLLAKSLCTNAICAPSRATILTGTYSQIHGARTLDDVFAGWQQRLSMAANRGKAPTCAGPDG